MSVGALPFNPSPWSQDSSGHLTPENRYGVHSPMVTFDQALWLQIAAERISCHSAN